MLLKKAKTRLLSLQQKSVPKNDQLRTMPVASISLIDKIKEIEKFDTGTH